MSNNIKIVVNEEENKDKFEISKLNIPWNIDQSSFDNFITINKLSNIIKKTNNNNNNNNNNHSSFETISPSEKFKYVVLRVPVSTPLDVSPLFPESSLSMDPPPVEQIEQFNFSTLELESENNSFITIKDNCLNRKSQVDALNNQLLEWRQFNHIHGRVFDSKSKFTLNLPNNNLFNYIPSVSYMTEARWFSLLDSMKHPNLPQTQRPDFIIEVRSYEQGVSNQLPTLHKRLCNWINSGVQSAILFDGYENQIYLYCQSSILQEQNNKLNHKDCIQQIYQLEYDIKNVQQDIQQIKESLHQIKQQNLEEIKTTTISPATIEKIEKMLKKKQEQENKLRCWDHQYFDNMQLVPEYPNVTMKCIPMVNEHQQSDVHRQDRTEVDGPDMLIHCIGVMNGFIIDLSKLKI